MLQIRMAMLWWAVPTEIISEDRLLGPEEMGGEGVETVDINYSFAKLYKKEGSMGHLIEGAQVHRNVCLWPRDSCMYLWASGGEKASGNLGKLKIWKEDTFSYHSFS